MTVARAFFLVTLLATSGLAATGVQAQEAPDSLRASLEVRRDTGRVDVRVLPPDALEAFRDDPDFAYDRQPPPSQSWWARFWAWLAEKLFAPLNDRGVGQFVQWVFWILAGLGLIYAVLKLLRMEPRGLFYGRSDRRRPAFAEVEDLHAVDFDRLIREATAEGDFRRAVRLLYLRTLKALADRELITWKPEKTNHEYLRELGGGRADLAAPFRRLTYLFEYIWYGDFPIDSEAFGQARDRFAAFDQTLKRSEKPMSGKTVAHHA